MALDEKTLKDFAQAVIGAAGTPSTLKYGTATVDGAGNTYVTIDGSSTMTPVIGNMDIRTGDRITVDIIDHQAVVTGNTTAPPSGRYATEQPLRVYTEYAKSNSPSIVPTTGWSELMPEHDKNDYIWSRVVNQFANGSTQTDTPKLVYGGTGADGKDSSSMELTSSRGTTFKSQDDGTTILVTVRKGETKIETLAEAILAYEDPTVYVEWKYKNLETGTARIIPSTHTGLLSDGFGLYLLASDTIMNCSDTKFTVSLCTSNNTICVGEITMLYAEPPTTLSLSTTNGTTLKDAITETTILSTAMRDGTLITNSTTAESIYGENVFVDWEYKNANEDRWHVISRSSSSVIDKGFQLKVLATEVDLTKTYRATMNIRVPNTGYSRVLATAEVTINDVMDGYTHGLTSYGYTFGASTPSGADVGATCSSVLYLYDGSEKKNIDVISVSVPSQYLTAVVKNNNTTAPYVEYTVKASFTSTQQALIKYSYNGITFEQVFSLSVAMKGTPGADGVGGLSYGADPSSISFYGDHDGVAVGTTANVWLYHRRGDDSSIITVTSSDIDCPNGLEIDSITASGTINPQITFIVTEKFYDLKKVDITMHALNPISGGYDQIETSIYFGVSRNGEQGPPGRDGSGTYALNVISDFGTIFTDREQSTTLYATIISGDTELIVDSSGYVYNGDLMVGRLTWMTNDDEEHEMTAASYFIDAYDVNPQSKISTMFRSLTGPSYPDVIYAQVDTTVLFCSSAKEQKRFYRKRTITDPVPSKPGKYPPSATNWPDVEPTITEDEVSTAVIYYVDGVLFTDGTYTYSNVGKYTAFESSKFALTKAITALNNAEAAGEASEEAKQNAYDALVAATAYLKLDPTLNKIIISKLGTSTWKSLALDSIGLSVGLYDPVNHTFDKYSEFRAGGVRVYAENEGSYSEKEFNGGYDIIYSSNSSEKPGKRMFSVHGYQGWSQNTKSHQSLQMLSGADQFYIKNIREMTLATYNEHGTKHSDRGTTLLALGGGETDVDYSTAEDRTEHLDGFFLGSIGASEPNGVIKEPSSNSLLHHNLWYTFKESPDSTRKGIEYAGPFVYAEVPKHDPSLTLFSDNPFFMIGGSYGGYNANIDFEYGYNLKFNQTIDEDKTSHMFIHPGSRTYHYDSNYESEMRIGVVKSTLASSSSITQVTFTFVLEVSCPILSGTTIRVSRFPLIINVKNPNETYTREFTVSSVTASRDRGGAGIRLVVTSNTTFTPSAITNWNKGNPLYVQLNYHTSTYSIADFDFS